VFVETDKYRNAALELYQAVGFQVIRDVLVYRKDCHDVHERGEWRLIKVSQDLCDETGGSYCGEAEK
jgi:hypothetical protein